ncbi:MAG: hypothetical protein ACRC46_09700 [Thermoguttaceae bacterium]
MISPSQITSFFQNGFKQLAAGKPSVAGDKTQKQAVNDLLTLSSLSKQLDLLNSEGAGGSQELSTEKINDMKERGQMMASVLKMKMSQFEGKLMKTLQDAGVDTDTSVMLQDAGEDGVKLLGDHPDADRIRQLFSEDSPITREFQEVSRLGMLVKGLQQIGGGAGGGVTAQYAMQSQDRWKLPAAVATVTNDGAQFAFE